MTKRTKELVLASILTALSILITYSPGKLNLGFFTLTVGAHVPTFIALFISPWVVAMTVLGSCLGFFMTIPAPNNIVVVVRAATHIFFALVGYGLIKKGKVPIIFTILITAVIHAILEGISVYTLTPLVIPTEVAINSATAIALSGTFVHHLLDAVICIPIIKALKNAKIIKI